MRTQSRNLTCSVMVWGLVMVAGVVYGHCQIPCGIYDDELRFTLLAEHILTIEKSMAQIRILDAREERDANQVTRWVLNKDKHADDFTQIITYYFLAQRVKPVSAEEGEAYQRYVTQVTLLHRAVVHAMKAKQTTDLAHVAALRDIVAEFRAVYLAEPGHKH